MAPRPTSALQERGATQAIDSQDPGPSGLERQEGTRPLIARYVEAELGPRRQVAEVLDEGQNQVVVFHSVDQPVAQLVADPENAR